MRTLLTALLLICGSSIATAQSFGIHYEGGTIPNAAPSSWIGVQLVTNDLTFYVPTSKKGTGGCEMLSVHPTIKINDWSERCTQGVKGQAPTIFAIPATAIKTLTLEQQKHHRIGSGIALSVVTLGAGLPVMLSKSTKDYIAITWDTGTARGSAEFQADKRDYRALLTMISGASGVPITAAVATE